MKNNKGITMMALAITIAVVLFLVGITFNYGKESIKKAQIENIKTNMLLIKAKTKEYVEMANFKAGTSGQLKENGNLKTEIANELKGEKVQNPSLYSYITYSEDNGQYLYDITDQLNDMGLKNIDLEQNEKYLVVYDISQANVEVYSTKGIQINQQTIHDLSTLQSQT